MAEKFYVTTSIVYVTAEPHIGYAMELIEADVMARWQRQNGLATYFLTGTDEHGQKLFNAAAEAGQQPQEFVDTISQSYQTLTKTLNLSNDSFIRTSSAHHKQAAQKLWQACAEDIYKGDYEGLYCVRCERFYTERETDAGKCPIHHIQLEWLKIESYFFRQSNYAAQIKHLIDTDALRIFPAKRKHEILNYLAQGLEDVSISRPKSQLAWGVEVPGDSDHVMYVWFDALTNYISGVGYGDDSAEFDQWWPADLHIIGKDISRFHCVMWPAMLLSAELEPPRGVYIHGFITDTRGEKISKSLGNTTDPTEIVAEYGVDALRYYLLRYIPHDNDGSFNMDLFTAAYKADLANDLGNLVSRVAAMINKYCQGKFAPLDSANLQPRPLAATLDDCAFDVVLADIFAHISELNKRIEDQKPWLLYTEKDHAKLTDLMSQLGSEILWLSARLLPFLPDTAQKIQTIFKPDGSIDPNPPILFPKHEAHDTAADAD